MFHGRTAFLVRTRQTQRAASGMRKTEAHNGLGAESGAGLDVATCGGMAVAVAGGESVAGGVEVGSTGASVGVGSSGVAVNHR